MEHLIKQTRFRPDAPSVAFKVYKSERASNADPVFLYGSLGSTVSMWDKNVAMLRKYFDVILCEPRGHGGSEVSPGPYTIDDLVDDSVAVADELDLDRMNFVGLSLGGMVGIRLAARFPELVTRMVLLCTSVSLGRKEWMNRAATVRKEGVQKIAAGVAERWYSPTLRAIDPGRIEKARKSILETNKEAYASCCEAIANMNGYQYLASIKAPTLLIAGEDDEATPVSHLQQINEGLPGSKLEILREAAHLANDEQPERVNCLIIDHLLKESS